MCLTLVKTMFSQYVVENNYIGQKGKQNPKLNQGQNWCDCLNNHEMYQFILLLLSIASQFLNITYIFLKDNFKLTDTLG
jgi:hypothetical protein